MIILLFNLLGVREHRAVYTVNFTFQIRESIVESGGFYTELQSIYPIWISDMLSEFFYFSLRLLKKNLYNISN